MYRFTKNEIKCIDTIEEQYVESIKNKKGRIINDIIDIVQYEFKYMPANRLETIIEEYLVSFLMIVGRNKIKAMDQELLGITKYCDRKLDEGKNTQEISYMLEDELNKLKRKSEPLWLEDLTSDFLSRLTSYMTYGVGNIENNIHFDDKITDIRNNIRSYLSRQYNELSELFMESLTTNFQNLTEEMTNIMQSEKQEDKEVETPKKKEEKELQPFGLDFEDDIFSFRKTSAVEYNSQLENVSVLQPFGDLIEELEEPIKEEKKEVSLDDQIFALEQNPIVQEYINLKQQQEEYENGLPGNILL